MCFENLKSHINSSSFNKTETNTEVRNSDWVITVNDQNKLCFRIILKDFGI